MYNCLNFDVYTYHIKDREFKKLVEKIFNDYLTSRNLIDPITRDYKKHRDVIRHIVFNAYFGCCVNLPISYTRNKQNFRHDKRYGKL